MDNDSSELDKFELQGMKIDVAIHADVRDLFRVLEDKTSRIRTQDISEWLGKIEQWRKNTRSVSLNGMRMRGL